MERYLHSRKGFFYSRGLTPGPHASCILSHGGALSDFSSAQLSSAQLTTQTSTPTVPAPAGREPSPSRAQFLTVSFFLEDSVFRRWLGCSPLWVGWLCLLVQCVICSHVTEGSVANALCLCLWPVTFKYCCSPQGCLFPPAPFSQDQVSTGATCQIH